MISANTVAKRSYFVRSVPEEPERAIAQVHLVEHDTPQARQVRAHHHVRVLSAEREGVVTCTGGAMANRDPRAFEPP
jgi:hypothetical protein